MRSPVLAFVCWLIAISADAQTPEPKPPVDGEPRVHPINLATALQLAHARPIDVQVAARQAEAAAAVFDRAKYSWLPSVYVGADYLRHDGAVQNFQGQILNANRNSLMGGFGANAVFSVSDGIFAPLAARQDLKARETMQLAVANDISLSVAEAYFSVQQARGELTVALQIVTDAIELVRRTEQLAEGLAPPLEATRARVELARRKQAVAASRERLMTASAELARLLRLDAGVVIEPIEPANMPVTLIDKTYTIDDLIPVALTTRPELAANQAFVLATLRRLEQERLRPLVPSVLIRSISTNPSGTLGYGVFAGGSGNRVGSASSRLDYDIQLVWEFQNLGLGNRARSAERKAEHEIAILEQFRTQDRVAAEVAKAFAEVNAAAERMKEAEPAFKDATDLVKKSMEAMTQTRRVGNIITLVVRPQEVVAAVQALGQSNSDYFAAVADYNRSQFRLYRALGHSSKCLSGLVPTVEDP
ncbi:TolC family protein [Zavarzinella formosa]|uniref:TolC family protein n=1 Tax=Zavarzinella formosa TaxID=360055 RepID=UPI00030F8E67|nr:TolC family protein [Zavarzinella formosa]